MKNCPRCNVSLEGGSIWEHFFRVTGSEESATDCASAYGATRENNKQWKREIGIYSNHKDRTVAYRCPDCYHEWERA